jgi:HlyD family secretion protein
MKKKIIIIIAMFVIFLSYFIYILFFKNSRFYYSAQIEAIETNIYSKISDNISKFYIREGDTVKKGDILFEFEGKDILASYDFAKLEFERIKAIYNKNAVSKEIYDFKKYQYDQSLINKERLTVKSPIDGKVLYKYYEEGEIPPAGRIILTIADLKEVIATAYVTYNRLASLKINSMVNAFLPEINKTFRGHIRVINDKAEFTPKNVQTKNERERLVYGVKIYFQNDENHTLKPGMTLEVQL